MREEVKSTCSGGQGRGQVVGNTMHKQGFACFTGFMASALQSACEALTCRARSCGVLAALAFNV